MELFNKTEIRDIVISVITLILIFAWKPFPAFGLNITLLPMLTVIVIVSFLLKQAAHKFVAQKFGLAVFYKMWPQGILFGLIFMILGLKLAAPGSIEARPYRFGRWGHRRSKLQAAEIGITSAVGPTVNIVLAIIFSMFRGSLFYQITFVNAWLAFFNLLPIPPLDGSKVLIWKPWIWGMMAALSLMPLLILFLRSVV